jgi:hypothetical protein
VTGAEGPQASEPGERRREERRPEESEPQTARERAERRRRRARVFGEVLPEATSDERADAWGDREGGSDEWLRRQVPPHHG